MVIYRADPKLNEVALLFDDGPNPKITPQLLQNLKQKDAAANFFLIGARAEESPEVVRQIIKDGHEVGNHTYTHKRLTEILKEKGEAAVKEEIEKGALAIEKAAGSNKPDIKFLRPPYLDWSEEVGKIAAQPYGQKIIMSGLAVGDYDWGVNYHWDDEDTPAIAAQSNRIIKTWSNVAGNGTLLGFHDSSEYNLPGNKRYETWMNRALPTLQAISHIIDDLRSKGLVIKKLSEMQLVTEPEKTAA